MLSNKYFRFQFEVNLILRHFLSPFWATETSNRKQWGPRLSLFRAQVEMFIALIPTFVPIVWAPLAITACAPTWNRVRSVFTAPTNSSAPCTSVKRGIIFIRRAWNGQNVYHFLTGPEWLKSLITHGEDYINCYNSWFSCKPCTDYLKYPKSATMVLNYISNNYTIIKITITLC